MGAMNAWGHLLVVSASADPDELWDFLTELTERAGTGHPGVHSMPPGEPRYCLHPTGEQDKVLRLGAAYVARDRIDEAMMWRRD